MATTEDNPVSLSKLFSQGQEMQCKIEKSQMNSNSPEYQVNAVYSNGLVRALPLSKLAPKSWFEYFIVIYNKLTTKSMFQWMYSETQESLN